MLFFAADSLVFEGLFDESDVLLWHHVVAQTTVKHKLGRFDGDVFPAELEAVHIDSPRIIGELHP